MRLTLDGRVLTAEIVRTPCIHRDPPTEEQLYGTRIDAICSPRSRPQRRGLVIRRQLWPAGARRMAFEFRRDISRRVKWCLIEHDASDVAFVSFIRRERPMFVGKGRGPSGGWWRLAGWRGLLAEPCAFVRLSGWLQAMLPRVNRAPRDARRERVRTVSPGSRRLRGGESRGRDRPGLDGGRVDRRRKAP
jgi:hypothetical protein